MSRITSLELTTIRKCISLNSFVQRSPNDCGGSLCAITKPLERGGHSPRWAAEPEKIKKNITQLLLNDFQQANIRRRNFQDKIDKKGIETLAGNYLRYEVVSKIFRTGASTCTAVVVTQIIFPNRPNREFRVLLRRVAATA
jgi:hypothetical protein